MTTTATIANKGTRHGLEPSPIDGTGMSRSVNNSSEMSSPELAKLNVEREKLELEVAQLRAIALGPEDQRTKAQNEREKDLLELQKLRQEVELESKNARLSQLFEIAKVIVPALSIFGSVWIGTRTLQYQHDKDRATAVSEQLNHFRENITSGDIPKQRNAIAAVRTLREDAIPSLLTNIDLYHGDIVEPLKQAVLKLNEERELRNTILSELLSYIKYTALRRDIPHLEYFVALWHKCLDEYKRTDTSFYRNAVSLGNKQAEELLHELGVIDTKDKELMKKLLDTIKEMSTKLGG
jgi:hypothetical protein